MVPLFYQCIVLLECIDQILRKRFFSKIVPVFRKYLSVSRWNLTGYFRVSFRFPQVTEFGKSTANRRRSTWPILFVSITRRQIVGDLPGRFFLSALQVPKLCIDLDLSLLYILILGTYSKFARKINFLALGVYCPAGQSAFRRSRPQLKLGEEIESSRLVDD